MSLVLAESLEGFLWTCPSHLNFPSSVTQNVVKKAPEFYRSELVNLFSWRKVQQMKINVSSDFFSFFQHVVCYYDYIRLKNPN